MHSVINSMTQVPRVLRFKKKDHLVWHNKQYNMKVLLNSFRLNGHTLVFQPLT